MLGRLCLRVCWLLRPYQLEYIGCEKYRKMLLNFSLQSPKPDDVAKHVILKRWV